MKMRGGALPWVLLIVTVLTLLFMYVLVDEPGARAPAATERHTSVQAVTLPPTV